MATRYACHQCGRTFSLPPTPSSRGGQNPKCLHCQSEFVEELLPTTGSRQRERDGDYALLDERTRNLRRAFGNLDDRIPSALHMAGFLNSSSEEEGDDEGLTSSLGPAQRINNPNHSSSSGFEGLADEFGNTFVINPLPGGGFIMGRGGAPPLDFHPLFSYGIAPDAAHEPNTSTNPEGGRGVLGGQLSFADMIRFVVNPESFSPEHPVWRMVGFQGDPRDYVFTENAFQRALSNLMEQAGNGAAMQGLPDDLLDELPRRIFGYDESKPSAGTSSDQRETQAKNTNNADDVTCAICQEGYKHGDEIVILACRHQFHADCILPWLKKVASCPICRSHPLPKGEEARPKDELDPIVINENVV